MGLVRKISVFVGGERGCVWGVREGAVKVGFLRPRPLYPGGPLSFGRECFLFVFIVVELSVG